MKLLSMLVTGLLENGMSGDLAAMVPGAEPIHSHLDAWSLAMATQPHGRHRFIGSRSEAGRPC
jgi:hypothetical protein